jgi:hypothetical protein
MGALKLDVNTVADFENSITTYTHTHGLSFEGLYNIEKKFPVSYSEI